MEGEPALEPLLERRELEPALASANEGRFLEKDLLARPFAYRHHVDERRALLAIVVQLRARKVVGAVVEERHRLARVRPQRAALDVDAQAVCDLVAGRNLLPQATALRGVAQREARLEAGGVDDDAREDDHGLAATRRRHGHARAARIVHQVAIEEVHVHGVRGHQTFDELDAARHMLLLQHLLERPPVHLQIGPVHPRALFGRHFERAAKVEIGDGPVLVDALEQLGHLQLGCERLPLGPPRAVIIGPRRLRPRINERHLVLVASQQRRHHVAGRPAADHRNIVLAAAKHARRAASGFAHIEGCANVGRSMRGEAVRRMSSREQHGQDRPLPHHSRSR